MVKRTTRLDTIEVYKDMGRYVLCKTVESRDGQVFIKMKKVTRRDEIDF